MELLTQESSIFGFDAGQDKDVVLGTLKKDDPLQISNANAVTGGDAISDIASGSSSLMPDASAPVADSTHSDTQVDNFLLGTGISTSEKAAENTDLLTGSKTSAVTALAAQADLVGDFFDSPEFLQAGGNVNVTYRVKNQGIAAAGSSTVKFYLSTNNFISTIDRELGSATVGALGSNGGNTGNLSKTVTLPPAGDPFWNSVGDGTYYIGMRLDANNQVAESNESNNANVGDLKDYDGVTVQNTKVADLSGRTFNVVQEPLKAGDSFDVQFNVQNTGPGKANSSWAGFYISPDKTISKSDRFLGYAPVSSLASGGNTGTLTKNLTLPGVGDSFWNAVKDGTYYIGMIADNYSQVSETNESNNQNTGEFKDYDGVYVYNQPKQVTVNIDRVAQIDDLDGWPGSGADFYSKVFINGVQQQSGVIEERDDVSPNWQFTQQTVGPVDIAIQLWESDQWSSTHVDIDSKAGDRTVNLKYDPLTGQITGDKFGSKGQQLYTEGSGDNNRGKMWFRVSHT